MQRSSPVDTIKLEAYFQLGRMYEQVDRDTAEQYFLQGIKLSKELNSVVYLAKMHHFLGITYGIDAQYDAAYEMLEHAIELYQEQDNIAQEYRALNAVALFQFYQGNFEASRSTFLEILMVYDSLGWEDQKIGPYINMALNLEAAKRDDEALGYYEKALELGEHINDQRALALSYNNSGSIYRRKGDLKRAVAYHAQSLEYARKINFQVQIGRSLSNMGANYTAMGDYNRAVEYLTQAITHAKNNGVNRNLVKSYLHMSEAYTGLNRYGVALNFTDSAMQLSKTLKLEDDILLAQKQYYEIYKKSNRPELAYSYADSILIGEEARAQEVYAAHLAEAEKKLENFQLKSENDQQKAQLELTELRRQRTIAAAATGMTLVLLFGGFIFYLNNKRHQQNMLGLERKHADNATKRLESHKRHIASVLHDELGQQLAILKSKSSELDNPELLADIDRAIQMTRDVSYDTYPYQLQRLGLNQAVQKMLQKLSEKSITYYNADLDDLEPLLTDSQTLIVFRIIQESLTNVHKHAHARSCAVQYDAQSHTLTVRDNGIGFDPSHASEGVGQSALATYARLLDANYVIHSEREVGTTVAVKLKTLEANNK